MHAKATISGNRGWILLVNIYYYLGVALAGGKIRVWPMGWINAPSAPPPIAPEAVREGQGMPNVLGSDLLQRASFPQRFQSAPQEVVSVVESMAGGGRRRPWKK